jgi:hypothetical protein
VTRQRNPGNLAVTTLATPPATARLRQRPRGPEAIPASAFPSAILHDVTSSLSDFFWRLVVSVGDADGPWGGDRSS